MRSNTNNLRVSIVIPVYNEVGHLAACLEAIAAQSVRPFEVIVVDNNSTDGTAAIASAYSFVRLLHEKRQGVIHARNTGFEAAHGAIIGRIDADTIISEHWVETLQKIFASRAVDAVSGSAQYHMVLAKVANRVDLSLRRYLARVMGRSVSLQGANMAIRRSTWRAIKGDLCHTGGMHEDIDLCIHANLQGYRIIFDERLVASLGFRQIHSSFQEYVTYVLLNPQTYAAHGLKVQRYMYPVVGLAIVFYMPVKIAHKGYDPLTGNFSVEKLLAVPEAARVNPATFVE